MGKKIKSKQARKKNRRILSRIKGQEERSEDKLASKRDISQHPPEATSTAVTGELPVTKDRNALCWAEVMWAVHWLMELGSPGSLGLQPLPWVYVSAFAFLMP